MSFLDNAETRARRMAARGARTALAGIFGIIALGFFTAAAWYAIDEAMHDPVWTSAIVGAGFGVVGLILWLANRQPPPPPPPQVDIADIIGVFLDGSRLGRQMRK